MRHRDGEATGSTTETVAMNPVQKELGSLVHDLDQFGLKAMHWWADAALTDQPQ